MKSAKSSMFALGLLLAAGAGQCPAAADGDVLEIAVDSDAPEYMDRTDGPWCERVTFRDLGFSPPPEPPEYRILSHSLSQNSRAWFRLDAAATPPEVVLTIQNTGKIPLWILDGVDTLLVPLHADSAIPDDCLQLPIPWKVDIALPHAWKRVAPWKGLSIRCPVDAAVVPTLEKAFFIVAPVAYRLEEDGMISFEFLPVPGESMLEIGAFAQTATAAERDARAAAIAAMIGTGKLDRRLHGSLHQAIKALGELRSEAAIPCLVEHLAFLPTLDGAGYATFELPPTEAHYPAAPALVRIGGRAADAMEAVIADAASSDVEKRLALWVLCEIRGRDAAAEWLAGRDDSARLSTGEALEDLLPTVGTVLAHPAARIGWVGREGGAAADWKHFEAQAAWNLPKDAMENALQRLGIDVSDEEIREECRHTFGCDPGDVADRTNESLRRLPRALRMARAEPERADEIYEAELEGVMSRGLWRAHLERNYTDAELDALESHPPMDGKDLRHLEESVREHLVARKLLEAVCGQDGTPIEREQRWWLWCRRQIGESRNGIPDDTPVKTPPSAAGKDAP